MATTQLHHHIFDAVGAKSIFQKEQASQMSYSNRKMKVSSYTKQELFSFVIIIHQSTIQTNKIIKCFI